MRTRCDSRSELVQESLLSLGGLAWSLKHLPVGMPAPQQRRGRERRDAIVRAAAEIAALDGFAAVSHRAVARRAGVPLGSTTYHFGSLYDLLGAAAGTTVDDPR
jgi:hypothetical protein